MQRAETLELLHLATWNLNRAIPVSSLVLPSIRGCASPQSGLPGPVTSKPVPQPRRLPDRPARDGTSVRLGRRLLALVGVSGTPLLSQQPEHHPVDEAAVHPIRTAQRALHCEADVGRHCEHRVIVDGGLDL